MADFLLFLFPSFSRSLNCQASKPYIYSFGHCVSARLSVIISILSAAHFHHRTQFHNSRLMWPSAAAVQFAISAKSSTISLFVHSVWSEKAGKISDFQSASHFSASLNCPYQRCSSFLPSFSEEALFQRVIKSATAPVFFGAVQFVAVCFSVSRLRILFSPKRQMS